MFRAQRELIKVFQSGRVAVIRISHKKGVKAMRLCSLFPSVRRFISPGLTPRAKRSSHRRRLLLEQLEGRVVPTVGVFDYYTAINLVSNVKGMALKTDPNLVNPWDINFPQQPNIKPPPDVYVADQGSGKATVYAISPNGSTVKDKKDLAVTIPTVGSSEQSGPTGVVQSTSRTPFTFFLPDGENVQATYIFDTLQGTIEAISNVNPTNAQIVFPNPTTTSTAEYTGLAVGIDTVNGNDYIYAANEGTNPGIQVFNSSFVPVTTFNNAKGKPVNEPFIDKDLPTGFIPYGVRDLSLGAGTDNDDLFVTYRSPNFQGGAVAVFTNYGQFLGQIASDTKAPDGTIGTVLQSPWGLAFIQQFGGVSGVGGDLLVGNFSSGQIDAYAVTVVNPTASTPGSAKAQFDGQLINKDGSVAHNPRTPDYSFRPRPGWASRLALHRRERSARQCERLALRRDLCHRRPTLRAARRWLPGFSW